MSEKNTPELKTKTIIFDLSEVLIAGILGVEKPLSTLLNIPEKQVLSAVVNAPLNELLCDRLTEDEYLALLIEQNDWGISAEFLKSILRENFRKVIPGMPELLEQLSRQYRLVLLSDHAREWIEFIEPVHPFLNLFTYRFYSFQLHQMKQEPSTFKLVLNHINESPSQCLFIDDSETNIRAAKEAGIPAIRFTQVSSLEKKLEISGG